MCGYHLRLHLDDYLSYDNFLDQCWLPDIIQWGGVKKTNMTYVPQDGVEEKPSQLYFNNGLWNTNKELPMWIDFQNENLIHTEP